MFLSTITLFFASFSHQIELLDFYGSLSDSKSPQVSRTFLSILVGLNNSVVWMVSILLLISNPFNFFSSLSEPFQVHQLRLVSLSLKCSTVLWQDPNIYLSHHFLLFFIWDPLELQNPQEEKYLFVNYHLGWPSDQDWMICSYFKIPENFMCIIL